MPKREIEGGNEINYTAGRRSGKKLEMSERVVKYGPYVRTDLDRESLK